ncbi:MAG: MFS transporter [Bacteroidetes bacterium]|nr:MAG: MFS transporter [Bacteroidota bacterium]
MGYIFKKNDPKVIKAWTFYDWANSVYNLIISTAIFPIFYQGTTAKYARENNLIETIGGETVEMVEFFGRRFVNSELYSYVYSASFLLVVLLVPILSGIADYSGTKKRFMQFFCYLGTAGCMSLFFFDVENLELSMLSIFVASIGFWGSLVFYNSFLLEIADKDQHDKISAKGFSLGYIGSVILLVTILLLNGVFEMQIKFGFLMVGVWWVVFAQYTYYYLPDSSHYPKREKQRNIIWYGYRELIKVWGELKQHARVKWFLASYFTYNMGVQTIMLLAVLFAGKEIDWVEGGAWWQTKETGLIVSIILIQLIAVAGAYVMSNLSSKLGNIRTLMIATVIWIVCTIVAYYIHLPMEFYVLAILVGFVMGGIQSLSRSTYSKMLPPTDDHASYFSFFDVMEKVGLIFGPLFFGILEGIFGNMRISVLMLMVFFIIGFFLLMKTRSVEKKSEIVSA